MVKTPQKKTDTKLFLARRRYDWYKKFIQIDINNYKWKKSTTTIYSQIEVGLTRESYMVIVNGQAYVSTYTSICDIRAGIFRMLC